MNEVSWSFAASNVARQIARPWSNGMTVAANDAVTFGGNLYIATTGGVTAAAGAFSQAGKVGNGLAEGGGSAIVWKGYAGTKFGGGITVVNEDATNVVRVGDVDIQNTPAPTGYGSVTDLTGDLGDIYVIASAGAPVVTIVGIR